MIFVIIRSLKKYEIDFVHSRSMFISLSYRRQNYVSNELIAKPNPHAAIAEKGTQWLVTFSVSRDFKNQKRWYYGVKKMIKHKLHFSTLGNKYLMNCSRGDENFGTVPGIPTCGWHTIPPASNRILEWSRNQILADCRRQSAGWNRRRSGSCTDRYGWGVRR